MPIHIRASDSTQGGACACKDLLCHSRLWQVRSMRREQLDAVCCQWIKQRCKLQAKSSSILFDTHSLIQCASDMHMLTSYTTSTTGTRS